MKPPDAPQLKIMVENFLSDPVVTAVLHTMPETIKTELLGNKSDFLAGYLQGVGRCLETLRQVDNNLKIGRVDKAASLRSMLSATVLLSAQELLRREAELSPSPVAEESCDQDS